MAEKFFVNKSSLTMYFTIFIREGNSPYDVISTEFFEVASGATKKVTFGDGKNNYLNGISYFTSSSGKHKKKSRFITKLGSEFDLLLNTNNVLIVSEVNDEYDLTGINDNSFSKKVEASTDKKTTKEENSNKETTQVKQKTEVNPMNVYVQKGGRWKRGNGSLAKPFSTIEEAIAAVDVGGTVNILADTYPITKQINVNKQGITIKGESGATLSLQADVVPLIVSADNITIEELIITSKIPYKKEFIQVRGNHTSIRSNTIFGPEQTVPMEKWIANRAIVAKENVQNLLVEDNVFHSLKTGIYVNPKVTGMINRNFIKNSTDGLVVDRALIVIDGISLGRPPNMNDIVLLAGTTPGPPYEKLTVLSKNNDNASILDKRNY